MDTILNLTQHTATPEQVEAGVFDATIRDAFAGLLTFDDPPTPESMAQRAGRIVELIAPYRRSSGISKVMIGGAPFFMSTLEGALSAAGWTPIYAFSRRVSEEVTLPDGTIRKTSIFRHAGFVSVDPGV